MTALAKFLDQHPDLTSREVDLLRAFDRSLVVRFEVTPAGRAVLNLRPACSPDISISPLLKATPAC